VAGLSGMLKHLSKPPVTEFYIRFKNFEWVIFLTQNKTHGMSSFLFAAMVKPFKAHTALCFSSARHRNISPRNRV
jgi:hypothetical protein